jgi:hypothetical protein
MPLVTSVCPGWMATRPLNRRPSTKTGQIRRAPPGREEPDTKPAHGIAVDDPERPPVRVGWQISGQQPDQCKGDEDPAVAPILAHTRAQIAVSDQGGTRHDGERDRERDARRMGEEGGPSAPAEDGQGERGRGAQRHERPSDEGHPHREAPTRGLPSGIIRSLSPQCILN